MTASLGGSLSTTVDDAFFRTLEEVRAGGHHTEVRPGGRASVEILAYQTGMTNPRARILNHPHRQLNMVGAVARAVWMIAGSDRLEDIAFYEPKVRPYTDNRISVPGSNYGARLFQPRPGVNQLEGVVARLREQPGSRQAAAVIWSPEDAVRFSADIPCAFGLFYHIRDGSLVATTAMRSNNAYLLLPYNCFEFSLIAEIVATELGCPLGDYVHWAASMHILDREAEAVNQVLETAPGTSVEMPPMPPEPSPLEQAYEVARRESLIRMATDRDSTAAAFAEARDNLAEYWHALLGVLVVHKLLSLEEFDEAQGTVDQLSDYLREPLSRHVQKARERFDATRQLAAAVGAEQLAIIEVPEVASDARIVAEAAASVPRSDFVFRQLEEACRRLEPELESPITLSEFQGLRERALELVRSRAAARSLREGEATDVLILSDEEVLGLIQSLRADGQ